MTTTSPSEDFLRRFHKICGMMGSEHVGERATAAHLATEMLKNAGYTWSDVTIIPKGKKEQPRRREQPTSNPFRQRPQADFYYRERPPEPPPLILDVEVVLDREKSMRVEYNGNEYVLPKSQITILVNQDPFYKISVPFWLAREKGLA